ncbi:MAG: 2-C-methyl-D-erythritol 4-phosphate cytidylyltransferase [Phycisphaerae bacterium]|nr:2-C-methyl-D-erythritol 4-phosphate cytidylyltransferase [Phycisphaerae bacterium]
MKVAVILPAAGKSVRFGLGDKLGQDLGGRPVLLRSVEAFAKRDDVAVVIVAAPEDGVDAFRDRYGVQLAFHGVKIVAGGRERWESVRNALALVPAECTHVAVHDAARPLVNQELIDRVFAAAGVAGAAIPGEPVSATLKRVTEETFDASADDAIVDSILGGGGDGEPVGDGVKGRRVVETVPRERMMAIQTPQVFERSLFERAYAQQGLDGATDDASLVERLGESVLVVQGDPRNLKITTQADLALAKLMLGARLPGDRPVFGF